MNSDPHESAAWRIFGLLDTDEAAAFDEVMHQDPELKDAYREMECLTAAVAAATTIPVAPRPGQLDRLKLKLNLHPSRRTNWLGISGWAAAAALALLLAFQHRPELQLSSMQATPQPSAVRLAPAPAAIPLPLPESAEVVDEIAIQSDANNHSSPTPTAPANDSQLQTKTIVKVETLQLIQEIEMLREKLVDFQELDRQRLTPIPGMAWPLVMRMTPPRGDLRLDQKDTDITAMLGDALVAADSREALPAETTPNNTEPSAIQIYDAAIDSGTLVVSNLPDPADDEEFSLFVSRKAGDPPILVGRLPISKTESARSFDYSLGSTGANPADFILIKNKRGQATQPDARNTILRGPR